MSVAGKQRLRSDQEPTAAAADLQRFVNAGRLTASTAQDALAALGLAHNDVAFICQLLEERGKGPLGPDLSEAAGHALDAVSRAVERMAAVLSLARWRPAQIARLDVREVIGAALFDLEARLSAFTVTADLESVSPVRAERGGLLQTLASLLLDAADNSPPRGRIAVALRSFDPQILVCIDDEGPAPLAPESLPEREGTPLWLCRNVVRSFGGELHVSQGSLGGRRVTVRLSADRP
jgi:C4-dicarboxylate-specific signal transduction histidine kinase